MPVINNNPINIYSFSEGGFTPMFQNEIFLKIKDIENKSELIDNYDKFLTGIIVYVGLPKKNNLNDKLDFFSKLITPDTRCFKNRNNVLTYDNLTTIREIIRVRALKTTTDLMKKTKENQLNLDETVYIPEQFCNFTKR